MLEYGVLLYCYGGNVKNVLEMGADIASTAAIFYTFFGHIQPPNVRTPHDYMRGRPYSKLMSHSVPPMSTKRYMLCAPNSLAYSSGSQVTIFFEKRVKNR